MDLKVWEGWKEFLWRSWCVSEGLKKTGVSGTGAIW